jgi:mannose-6-phosphate isomerase-like protein (cupin superfamily)
VQAGDTVCIPAGTPHRVMSNGETVLRILCVCTPPYADDDTEILD